jgi:putative transposase
MPRKARLLVPGCPHHIVQRGHNRNTVFVADEDYQFYLENLFEWKVKLGIKVYAWCLMTNHVHLIVEPGNDASTISALMKRLAGRQSAFVNKLEKRTGSLWDGRFKASPIQRDEYMLSCIRYVEMNPVRANMVAGPRQYRWSSYRERMGLENKERLDLDQMYLSLADSEDARRARYKEYVRQGISDKEIKLIRNSLQRNKLTGDDRFTEEILQRIGIRVENRSRGRPSQRENRSVPF